MVPHKPGTKSRSALTKPPARNPQQLLREHKRGPKDKPRFSQDRSTAVSAHQRQTEPAAPPAAGRRAARAARPPRHAPSRDSAELSPTAAAPGGGSGANAEPTPRWAGRAQCRPRSCGRGDPAAPPARPGPAKPGPAQPSQARPVPSRLYPRFLGPARQQRALPAHGSGMAAPPRAAWTWPGPAPEEPRPRPRPQGAPPLKVPSVPGRPDAPSGPVTSPVTRFCFPSPAAVPQGEVPQRRPVLLPFTLSKPTVVSIAFQPRKTRYTSWLR